MYNLVENRFLVTSAVTKEVSSYASRELEYDYWEVMQDACKAITGYYNEINLDRRVLAVGSEVRIHVWDIMSGNIDGWKEHIFVASGMYGQMIADMTLPSRALIIEPDRQYDLVALLASRGCELFFLNNECLFLFENFIRDLPSYPFSFSYKTIDRHEIPDPSLSFDFVNAPLSDLILEDTLLDDLINSMNSGAVMYTPYANESGRMYSEDYHIEPATNVYEEILSRNDINSYHMPGGIGYQISIKK